MHILDEFILPLARLALIQPHTVVHELCAVGGTLIVLPDRDGFVDTFDGDGVNDVFLSRTFLHFGGVILCVCVLLLLFVFLIVLENTRISQTRVH